MDFGIAHGIYISNTNGTINGINNGLVLGTANGLYCETGLIDPDAQSFIVAAGITNLTQREAIYTLVKSLKNAGLWLKMYAIYPVIGANARSHSYNLINPAQYQITFFGTVGHSTNGMVSNGTTGYGLTGFVPSLVYNSTDLMSLSYYSRTNVNNPIGGSQTMIGSLGNNINPGGNALAIRATNGTSFYTADIAGVTNRVANNATLTNSSGFFAGSQNGTNVKLYRNGSDVTITQGAYTSLNVSNLQLGIMTLNNTTLGGPAGFISPHQCAFAHIGQKLTDAENTTLYNIVQRYQTILGRQVS